MRAGDLVAGRFEIEQLAATGGMARVYRAIDRDSGSVVALKLLDASGAAMLDRFARESRVLADLAHPAIVRYIAHGKTSDGEPFLVMEWLEGEDLESRLRRDGLDIAETIELGRRIGESLGAAHRRGIVHRDVKPSNIFLRNGRVSEAILLDFGIARLQALSRRLTRTGMTMGTPGYMSPEQARGDDALDPRSDVFSLGCVLFECIARRPAFVAAHAAALLGTILFEDPQRLSSVCPDVPAALDDLVTRMIAKTPSERPEDGDATASALAALETSEAPPRSQAALVASLTDIEQRLVSVVVIGTTTGPHAPTLPWTNEGEGRAPIEALRAAARRHRARIEVLADGSIVALLPSDGSPVEQAARAARCALAMRLAVKGIPMVLATGRGVLGGPMPVGEVIDRAVSTLDDSLGDSIRIDDTTAGLLDARFEVQAQHEQRPGDAALFLLKSERSPIDSTRTLLGHATPCVGRERELSLLEASWTNCVSEPRGTVVLVTSPAGMGKSRLSQEFLRRVRRSDGTGGGDLPAPVEIIIARGDPLSAGSTFGMIAPALRRWAGILEGEPTDASRDKLLQALARHLTRPRAMHVGTFLGELAGVPAEEEDAALRAARDDAILMGDQMRAAWEDWQEGITKAGPVLVVLEDLHWGDLPTIQLVDAALRRLRDAPFMVLALARPEVHERFPDLWSAHDVVEVRLGRLSQRAATRLVRDVLGEGPTDADVERIVTRADGNALYLEELIRATAEGARDRLPDTVYAMVEARLDAIPPEARRVLRAASVFGQSFWRGGVAALLGTGSVAVRIDEWLNVLIGRELITRRPHAVYAGEIEYRFCHDVVREAAYGMLTDTDRSLGHRLAGAWLERMGSRDALKLAEHFERGKDGARAIGWYELAAEEALEGNDFDASFDLAERGIACGAEGATCGHLRLVQTEALGWRGAFERAERHALLATRDLRVGSAIWFRAVGELVYSCAPLGRRDAVIDWADKAMATPSTDASTQAARVVALSRCAFHLVSLGEYERAGEVQRQAERSGTDVAEHDAIVAARLRQTSGFARFALDDLAGAINDYLAAADLFQCAGAARQRHFSLTQASFVYLELGQYAEAELLLRDTYAISQRMGITYSAAMALINLTFALVRQGAVDDPLVIGNATIGAFAGLEDRRIDGISRCYLAEILRSRGELEVAEREGQRALDALAPFPPVRARALGTMATVLLAAKRGEDALARAREGMALLDKLGSILTGESILRLAYARALFETGARAAANDAIAIAHTRMLERAARIAPGEPRTAFLSTAEHAETAALAAAWSAS